MVVGYGTLLEAKSPWRLIVLCLASEKVVFHTHRAVGNEVGKTLVRICRNQLPSVTC